MPASHQSAKYPHRTTRWPGHRAPAGTPARHRDMAARDGRAPRRPAVGRDGDRRWPIRRPFVDTPQGSTIAARMSADTADRMDKKARITPASRGHRCRSPPRPHARTDRPVRPGHRTDGRPAEDATRTDRSASVIRRGDQAAAGLGVAAQHERRRAADLHGCRRSRLGARRRPAHGRRPGRRRFPADPQPSSQFPRSGPACQPVAPHPPPERSGGPMLTVHISRM